MQNSAQQFQNSIVSQLKKIEQYYIEDSQINARALIPIEIQTLQILENQDDCLDILKLKLLLQWFKSSFFKWTNNIPCSFCQCTDTKYLESQQGQLPEEIEGQANVVEIFQCDLCETHSRFARFNNPKTLLQTRQGRCGEWANCFTLCCISIGLKARIVLDFTDHVWTEVWSNKHQRFIHADSCENQFDQPLLYEKGWGKKLNYLIAIGLYGVKDVTFRYTDNYQEVSERRKQITEQELEYLINNMNQFIQEKLFDDQEALINSIIMNESDDLQKIIKKDQQNKDNQKLDSRQSGDQDWIKSRGEDGQK